MGRSTARWAGQLTPSVEYLWYMRAFLRKEGRPLLVCEGHATMYLVTGVDSDRRDCRDTMSLGHRLRLHWDPERTSPIEESAGTLSINLFIDTNVFLSFYHLTGEDLEELKKLAVLLENDEIKLFLPEQVVCEFHRNRDGKIAEALKGLQGQKLNLQFPQMCKDYPEYSKLRDLQKEYDQVHSSLLTQMQADIEGHSLKADSLFASLSASGQTLPMNSDLLSLAGRGWTWAIRLGRTPLWAMRSTGKQSSSMYRKGRTCTS